MADKIDTASLLARVDIVDVIERYVPLKKAGAEFEACCPFHAEKSPSFKVNKSKQIFQCFGCGAGGDAISFLQQHLGVTFIEAVDMLGGGDAKGAPMPPAPARKVETKPEWTPILPVPADAPPVPKAHPFRGLPEMTWAYRDQSGALLGYVYRFIKSDGVGKEVMPIVWAQDDAGRHEWRWMAFPKPRPLYGLDRLAAKPDALVLLVEGEKCADAGDAELPELVVMAWPGGGKADDKVDWSPLAGRRVMTWADADHKREKVSKAEADAGMKPEDKPFLPPEEQEGYQTMLRIRERLRAMDCKLWDVKLPPAGVKPDGWDIADAVEEGLRGKDLANFIRSNLTRLASPAVPLSVPDCPVVPERAEQTGTEQNKPRKPAEALIHDVVGWLEFGQPQEWIIDGLLQRGNLYACTAVTNHGKTAVTLNMALSVAAGKTFAGRTVRPGKVLILCGENPDGFRTRLNATLESLGLEHGDINGIVEVIPRALPLGAVVERIRAEAIQRGGEYVLVVVDTSISYFGGDNEDDNLQARTHAWHLRALSQLPGSPAIVANAHPTKSATKDTLTPRGGGAFLNEIDTNLTVWSEGEVATLHWHHKKRGPDFEAMVFEFVGKTVVEHGVSVPTVTANWISDERAHQIKKARNQDEDRLLYALQHHPDDTFAAWATHCGWNGEKAKSKVSRVMERLREDKLVFRSRKGWTLTPSGEREASGVR